MSSFKHDEAYKNSISTDHVQLKALSMMRPKKIAFLPIMSSFKL